MCETKEISDGYLGFWFLSYKRRFPIRLTPPLSAGPAPQVTKAEVVCHLFASGLAQPPGNGLLSSPLSPFTLVALASSLFLLLEQINSFLTPCNFKNISIYCALPAARFVPLGEQRGAVQPLNTLPFLGLAAFPLIYSQTTPSPHRPAVPRPGCSFRCRNQPWEPFAVPTRYADLCRLLPEDIPGQDTCPCLSPVSSQCFFLRSLPG